MSEIKTDGFLKNRKQRLAEKKAFSRQLKGVVFDALEDVTAQIKMSGKKMPNLGEFVGFYKNSLYSIQVYKKTGNHLLGIRRHDQKAICPWNHKQRIKNHIFGDEVYAIEIFPPVSELTDQANMYWLWAGGKIEFICKHLGGLNSEVFYNKS